MGITSEIEAMITESTRDGRMPRYIVIGHNQFSRWNEELSQRHGGALKVENRYMGCDIVICSSDIIEVVGAAESEFRYLSLKK